MSSAPAAKANRLANEKSPYLLQHAHNPVDWYPWGPEAFEAARKQDKPILVSIGYSTCHWCHVMERESYEDPDTAALMNKLLINIKVDREERPDVDKIYMTAVSAMTGQGGWPLNVFLTPELKPIFGGTYFPPESKWGQPAWKDVVKQIGESWRHAEDHLKMSEAAEKITESLQKYVAAANDPAKGTTEWLDGGFKALQGGFDSAKGGFGRAPKFPMPVYHNFLLRYWARNSVPHPNPLPKGEGAARTGEAKEALDMSVKTLKAMAAGGIYDHLGGGFARYSTDADWHIPHFEKMLYDNAQLAINYLEAYQATRDSEFKRIAQEALAYIRRDMTHPDGGFYSAEDADSLPSKDAKEKKEGAFYIWGKSEIIVDAGDQAGEAFAYRYGALDHGNAKEDPHGEFVGKNILFVAHTVAETAKHMGIPEPAAQALLNGAKSKLLEARAKRPRPHLDDKIVTAWNGLMISAYAKGYQVLGDPEDLAAAQKAARFLKEKLYDAKSRTLYRRWREGERKDLGIADDYAFVAQGLLDLYETDFNKEWLTWASELMDEMDKRFYDTSKGGYFMTAADQDKNLILRVKEDSDNVEPSASSVAALSLLRLSQHLDRKDLEEKAEKTLAFYGMHMKESPASLPQMLVALDFALTEPRQVVIAGKPGAPDTEAMLKTLREHFVPVKTVVMADEKSDYKPLHGQATAYVCFRHVCKEPTNDLKKFSQLLNAL